MMSLVAVAALPMIGSCALDDDTGTLPTGRERSQQELETMRSGISVGGQVVVDWNENAFENAFQVDGYADLFIHLRAITMMHLAMHDAVNGVIRKYTSYATDACDRRADPVAAAAAAAHGVLVAVYPDRDSFLDDRLEQSLAAVPDGDAEDRGVALGEAAAASILALRSDDGSDQSGEYTPGSEPGDYQFVPPFDSIYRPAWRFVRPFALRSVDQFRSAPPPALDTRKYATDYNEVREYGRMNGSTRTADQTSYADWWYELSDIGWNRIARVTWAQEASVQEIWPSARMFALLNAALMDGYLAGWDSKLHYDFWRPYTAVRAGETDGNDATEPEALWEPYCVTPPIQDYPSTHSILGAAGAGILLQVFNRDVPFTMESTTSKPPGQTRSFSSLSSAALENADSRVACGIHFRFATTAGLLLGTKISHQVTRAILRPIR